MSAKPVDELKAAKALGYSNGYQAGRKRLESDMARESRAMEERRFWSDVFIAATPSFIEAKGWKQGDTELTSLDQRSKLASDFADEAIKLRRKATK